jgi:hypothetical protein
MPPKPPVAVIGVVQAVLSWFKLLALMGEPFAALVDCRLPWATGQSVAYWVTSFGTGVPLKAFGVAGPAPAWGCFTGLAASV